MTDPAQTGVLLEHLFRRNAGRIIAHLARILGPSRLDLAEEAVQESMLRALNTWPYHGVPENPDAWLFRVAHNQAIDALRRDRLIGEKSEILAAELERASLTQPGDPDVDEQLRDDELRMIFMCCHPQLPRESSIALSLKIVCGFSVREIARAFLAEDAAIAQRLVRAKKQIAEHRITLEMPHGAALSERLDAVLSVLYFLFNEGYTAHEGDALIRRDLCLEALRLGQLVSASSVSAPRVHALVALIALQAARNLARTDDAGDLVILERQDRTRWDQRLIAIGFHHLDQAISGDEVSEYHVQAAIAATHARTAHAETTEWSIILDLYDQLLEINNSPVVALNRAVAVARVYGPAKALAEVDALTANDKLQEYYLLLAVRGHLLFQLGRTSEAAEAFRSALRCRCSEPERRFLQAKLTACVPGPPI